MIHTKQSILKQSLFFFFFLEKVIILRQQHNIFISLHYKVTKVVVTFFFCQVLQYKLMV